MKKAMNGIDVDSVEVLVLSPFKLRFGRQLRRWFETCPEDVCEAIKKCTTEGLLSNIILYYLEYVNKCCNFSVETRAGITMTSFFPFLFHSPVLDITKFFVGETCRLFDGRSERIREDPHGVRRGKNCSLFSFVECLAAPCFAALVDYVQDLLLTVEVAQKPAAEIVHHVRSKIAFLPMQSGAILFLDAFEFWRFSAVLSSQKLESRGPLSPTAQFRSSGSIQTKANC